MVDWETSVIGNTEQQVLITTRDDSGIRVFGALRKTAADVVQVSLPLALAERTLVSLQLSPDCYTDGEVTACWEADSAYVVDIKISELRREPRFTIDDPVLITVLSLAGQPRIDGRVAEISRNGLGVVAKSAVPPGCPVKVEMSTAVIVGQVVHCRKTADGFRAGVHIETVMFREEEAASKPEAPPIRPPGSLWGALKRLYHAVKS